MGINVVFGSVAADHRRRHERVSQSACTYGSRSTSSVDVFGLSRGSLSSSPERLRRSDSGTLLDVVPEGRMIMEFPNTERYTAGAPLRDGDDDEDSEEAEWELDEELEEHGLYRGMFISPPGPAIHAGATNIPAPSPYPSAPYLPHPLPELLTSSALFSLGHLLRGPIFALFAGTSIFPTLFATATHSLLTLVLQLSALPLLLVAQHTPARPTTHHFSFRRVWWLALGCAAAEALVAIRQGFAARALYRDVLVSVRRTDDDGHPDTEARAGGHKPETRVLTPLEAGAGSRSGSPSPQATIMMGWGGRGDASGQGGQGQSAVELFEREEEDDVYDRARSQPFSEEEEEVGERQPLLSKNTDAGNGNGAEGSALRMQVEDDLQELLAIRAREEMEQAYGVAVIRIPVFLSCLQRINVLLLTLGLTLLLSQAYLRSTIAPLSFFSLPPSLSLSLSKSPPQQSPAPRSDLPLSILAPVCWAVHTALALLHTPLLLPRIGIPAVVYAAALVSLGAFFAGLALWEGLS
ncbi:hypothetical protein D9615_007916 [Tricholomella constricta]|uniref:Uncharacterized protein n=1 Tax=Tricholomella constricta TaxID=117010 RepID=A0A8H5LZS9_9AGAR|nr:hypothetical protein D9615_007916 [Tricholomella constricta]